MELIKIVMIIIIVMQIIISYFIFTRLYELSTDPLIIGARKHHIDNCLCIISETQSVFFNTTDIIYNIKYKKDLNTFKFNIS